MISRESDRHCGSFENVFTILKNILQFTGLVVAVPVSIPHLLNTNGVPVKPQFGATSAGGFHGNR